MCAVPGIGYGESCDGFMRVGVGTESMDRTRRALRAVKEMIAATRRPDPEPADVEPVLEMAYAAAV